MAKAISAVIATIMLLMITVALIGVFYVFGAGLLTSGTSATGESASRTTDLMLKTIAVPVAKCGNNTPSNNIINFTVQNLGTKDILAGDMKIYVDDNLNTAETPDLAVTGLSAGAQLQVGVSEATQTKTRNLKVQGPSNTVQQILSC